MARQTEGERARLVHGGIGVNTQLTTVNKRPPVLLPCGCTLPTRDADPRAQAYRLQRDTARHDCALVSHTNPSGLKNKRAGE